MTTFHLVSLGIGIFAFGCLVGGFLYHAFDASKTAARSLGDIPPRSDITPMWKSTVTYKPLKKAKKNIKRK